MEETGYSINLMRNSHEVGCVVRNVHVHSLGASIRPPLLESACLSSARLAWLLNRLWFRCCWDIIFDFPKPRRRLSPLITWYPQCHTARCISNEMTHRNSPSNGETSSMDNILVYQTSFQAQAMAEDREGEDILLTETGKCCASATAGSSRQGRW